jgi:hypothetical protein
VFQATRIVEDVSKWRHKLEKISLLRSIYDNTADEHIVWETVSILHNKTVDKAEVFLDDKQGPDLDDIKNCKNVQ